MDKKIKKDEFWFNPIHDECANLSNLVWDLRDLSSAFRKTGNTEVSDEIGIITNKINIARENIYKAVGKAVNEEFNRSEQSSLNVLNAALAGIGLESKHHSIKIKE